MADEYYLETDFPALVHDLRVAFEEIRGADCPGHIAADIPAMVLADLAALNLEQWAGDAPEVPAKELVATIAGSLAYMLGYFTGEADGEWLRRLLAAVAALDALTTEDLRPRFGKLPGVQARSMH